jgi:hypothetical protein
LQFRNNSIENKMLNKYFNGTKQAVNRTMKQSESTRHMDVIANKTKEMIPWLDPQLADAANRLVIYQQLKMKAMANEELIKKEQALLE